MRILEAFSAAKSGDESLNEDALVVGDKIAAVFDGETSKERPTNPTGGRLAAQACAAAVLGIEPGSPPYQVVEALHTAVRALNAGPGAAAVGAVLDSAAGWVVRVGDVAVAVDGRFDLGSKPSSRAAAQARAAMTAALLTQGVPAKRLRTEDPGRAMIMPLLVAQRVWRNHPTSRWGFGCIDGTATPPQLIDVFWVPDGCEVVLASDGYFDPRPTLAASEAALSVALTADPLRISDPPATKGVTAAAFSFDDRSYLRAVLT